MKKIATTTIIILAIFLTAGCKTEKKATRYENMYTEKTAVIYIEPIVD